MSTAPNTTPNIGAPSMPALPSARPADLAAQARSLVDNARSSAEDRVRSTVETGKNTAADTLTGVAQSLLTASQQLKSQQKGAGDLVEQAGQQVNGLADYLKTTNVDDLVQRTESWARENPALFIGGAFALGILGARFLKSTRPAMSTGQGGAMGSTARFADREVAAPHAVRDL